MEEPLIGGCAMFRTTTSLFAIRECPIIYAFFATCEHFIFLWVGWIMQNVNTLKKSSMIYTNKEVSVGTNSNTKIQKSVSILDVPLMVVIIWWKPKARTNIKFNPSDLFVCIMC